MRKIVYVVRNAIGEYHTGKYLPGKYEGERTRQPGLAAEFDLEREAGAHCEQDDDQVLSREIDVARIEVTASELNELREPASECISG